MKMLSEVVSVNVDRCRAIEFNAEIKQARNRLEQYVVTPDIVKMLSRARDRLLWGSREEVRSLYLYSAYGKGKSYYLLALRALFEGWGRDILLPKLPDHERQTWEQLLNNRRHIVVSLDSLEHACFEDAIRYDLLKAVARAQGEDPALANLPFPASVFDEVELVVDYWRNCKPSIFSSVEGHLEGMSLDLMVQGLRGPRASEYHQRFVQACVEADVPLTAVMTTRTPVADLVEHFLQHMPAPYEGFVILCDELGQALDSARVTPDDTQALARLVNWAAQPTHHSLFIAVGQGRLADHGKHLQGATDPVSSLAGRLEEVRFHVEDMQSAVAGALSVNWDELHQEVSDDNEFWKVRADRLKALQERVGGQAIPATSYMEEARATYPLHAMLVAFLPTITNLHFTQRERALFDWLSLPKENNGLKRILESRPLFHPTKNRPSEIYLADYYDFVEHDLEDEAPDHVAAYRRAATLAQDELERDVLKTIAILTIPVTRGINLDTSLSTIATSLEISDTHAREILKRLEDVGAVQRDRGYFLPDSAGGVSSTILQNEVTKARKAEWETSSGALKPVTGDHVCEVIAKFAQYRSEFIRLGGEPEASRTMTLPAPDWPVTKYNNEWHLRRTLKGEFVTASEVLKKAGDMVANARQSIKPVLSVLYVVFTARDQVDQDSLEEAALSLSREGYVIGLLQTGVELEEEFVKLKALQTVLEQKVEWKPHRTVKVQLRNAYRELLKALSDQLSVSRFRWYAPPDARAGGTGVSDGQLDDFLSAVLERRFCRFPGKPPGDLGLQRTKLVDVLNAMEDGKATSVQPQMKRALDTLRAFGLADVHTSGRQATIQLHSKEKLSNPKMSYVVEILDRYFAPGTRLVGHNAIELLRTLMVDVGLTQELVVLIMQWYRLQVQPTLQIIATSGSDVTWTNGITRWIDAPQEWCLVLPRESQEEQEYVDVLVKDLGRVLAAYLGDQPTCSDLETLTVVVRRFSAEIATPLISDAEINHVTVVQELRVGQLLMRLSSAEDTMKYWTEVPGYLNCDRTAFVRLIHEHLRTNVDALMVYGNIKNRVHAALSSARTLLGVAPDLKDILTPLVGAVQANAADDRALAALEQSLSKAAEDIRYRQGYTHDADSDRPVKDGNASDRGYPDPSGEASHGGADGRQGSSWVPGDEHSKKMEHGVHNDDVAAYTVKRKVSPTEIKTLIDGLSQLSTPTIDQLQEVWDRWIRHLLENEGR